VETWWKLRVKQKLRNLVIGVGQISIKVGERSRWEINSVAYLVKTGNWEPITTSRPRMRIITVAINASIRWLTGEIQAGREPLPRSAG